MFIVVVGFLCFVQFSSCIWSKFPHEILVAFFVNAVVYQSIILSKSIIYIRQSNTRIKFPFLQLLIPNSLSISLLLLLLLVSITLFLFLFLFLSLIVLVHEDNKRIQYSQFSTLESCGSLTNAVWPKLFY